MQISIESITVPTTSLPCQVDLDDIHYSHVLTKSLRHPDTLPLSPFFLQSYSRFTIKDEPGGSIMARDAVLMKLQVSRSAVLLLLILAMMVAVMAGLVAGMIWHSLDAVLGVFGAVATLVAFIEGFVTWWLG